MDLIEQAQNEIAAEHSRECVRLIKRLLRDKERYEEAISIIDKDLEELNVGEIPERYTKITNPCITEPSRY